MGSIGAVAVGAGVGVGVGIGVGVAVDIGVGMAVGVGVGVAVGIGVGMTVGMEVGSAVGAGSVGVGSLPQATSTADARAIAITRQSRGTLKKCVNSQAVYPLSEQHGLEAQERR